MNTIAQNIITILGPMENIKTVSLYSGRAEWNDGTVVIFQGGSLFNEKRNDKGRAIKAQYGYADGSQIEYTWSESKGPQVKEIQRWLK